MNSDRAIRLTVWNEFVHEKSSELVRSIYPDGIHQVIASFCQELLGERMEVRCATLEEQDHGLSEERLAATDVLTWWGHAAHDQVEDRIVDRVCQRVREGMGLIVLHSGHASKVFQKLMGTSCMLRWREAAETERLWIVDPGHPIVHGLELEDEHLELNAAEMYGEFFDIPTPDELVMISWFEGGEVFRSACTFRRGAGKIFYFRPGHETYPIYHHSTVQRIIANGVLWAAPTGLPYHGEGRQIEKPLNAIRSKS